MQTVFVCGGKGTRLAPRRVGPKSLLSVGGTTLLARIVVSVRAFHDSARPPIVIVDARDNETPLALTALVPAAHAIRQAKPDGVANALLLAEPVLDDLVLVTLGDLFLDGAFAPFPRGPGLVFWRDAPAAETQKNFGVSLNADGFVSGVIEKPVDCHGLRCGMGVYVLTRSVISAFRDAPIDPRTGERGITAAVQAALDAGVAFHAIPFSGYYNNVNSLSDVAAVEHHLVPVGR